MSSKQLFSLPRTFVLLNLSSRVVVRSKGCMVVQGLCEVQGCMVVQGLWLINKIQPGAVKSISSSAMTFKQMENVSKFNEALKAYGVSEASTFQTADLVENQDMATVQNAIWQLICQFRKKGGNTKYGIKIADKNERDFDEETMKKGQTVIGLRWGVTRVPVRPE
ncbi:putative calponin-3-like isoform 1 [Apostichopus japonicus]|uniref:Putative calponin-3-like isoform 1 n=1 Tax=Stichopus japonicus TaxID=307972 RepID=A0A2G8LHL9_STIJA|nr:putative calponin-3-like isoform 1 [Apostichopus japonicus]